MKMSKAHRHEDYSSENQTLSDTMTLKKTQVYGSSTFSGFCFQDSGAGRAPKLHSLESHGLIQSHYGE